MKHYDVIIVGGGFVGYTAALALAKLDLNIAILEANKRPLTSLQNIDGRAIVLAHTSCLLLKNLNVWPRLNADACAIKSVHTSQQGHFGKLRIHASQLDIDYLGQVVVAPTLGYHLAQAVEENKNITEIIRQVDQLEQHDDKVVIDDISASIALACDGTNSMLREKMQLKTQVKNQQQSAIVANIDIAKPHQNIAYERFTKSGTLALLPLNSKRMTSVLSLEEHDFLAIKNENDEKYLQRLQQLFGKKLGEFSNLGKRFSYPLKSVQCEDMHKKRFLLLGNAVHTINPIAAQGLNLAMRDIAILFDAIAEDGLTPAALSNYKAEVLPAHKKMSRFTECLVTLAHPKRFKLMRSLGLLTLDNTAGVKRNLANALAGFSAHRGKTLQAVQDDL